MARVRSSLLAAGLAAAVLLTAAPAYAAAPPTTVSALSALPADRQVTLRWTNPADADFAGVTVVEKHDGSAPAAVGDGTTVYAGTAASTVVTGLANGTAYRFAVFTRNTADEVSSPAVTDPIVPIPALATTVGIAVTAYTIYGGHPRVTATLRRSDNGAVLANETVGLYRKPYGASTWSKAYTLKTNSAGVVTALTNASKNTSWQARHEATPYFAASTSPSKMAYIRPNLTVTRTPAYVEQNQPSVVSVTVTPNHAGQTVALQRLVGDDWTSIAGAKLSSTSKATFKVATSVIGTRTYRLMKRADADHAAGYFHAFRIVTIRRTLRSGMSGADVAKVEKRLAYLHYDAGHVNDYYDYDTTHAIMAFQKVNGLRITGEVNTTTYSKLWHQVTPKLRHPQSGSWVEADLTKQVLYFTRNGAIAKILDISSGSGEYYTVDGETQRAVTPTGSFRIFHKIDGMRTSRLGQLWRPAYFASGGFAIHGSGFVPAWPDSHGCIRITNSNMDRLFSSLTIGMRVYVYRS